MYDPFCTVHTVAQQDEQQHPPLPGPAFRGAIEKKKYK
jgi:hypothetical protein